MERLNCIQDKQSQEAKTNTILGQDVAEMTSEVVHQEHLKCRVSILHLFVIITDRAFSAVP